MNNVYNLKELVLERPVNYGHTGTNCLKLHLLLVLSALHKDGWITGWMDDLMDEVKEGRGDGWEDGGLGGRMDNFLV